MQIDNSYKGPLPLQSGSTGLKVDHLTFFKHPMALEAEAIAGLTQFEFISAMTSAIQSQVTFANQWSVSLITYDPSAG